MSENPTRKIGLTLILGWIVGVVFIAAGAGTVLVNPVAGFIYVLAGLIVFPPVAERMKKGGVELSGALKVVLFLVLVGIAGSVFVNTATKEAPVGGNESSTSTETKQERSAKDVEIVDVGSRVTESNDVWWKFAWKLTLRNNTDRNRSVTGTIKWMDKDGYVVDSDRFYSLETPANSEKTFEDYTLIDTSAAVNVEGVKAELGW